jgi:hypothetical protein
MVPCGVAALLFAASVPGQTKGDCRVDPFHGAATPQGAVATMRVRNTGAACLIHNYGTPDARGHPAESGNITKEPAHGKAVFNAPAASYVPAPGFVGEDEFAYEARAKGNVDQSVVLRVRVKVVVAAP